MKKSDWLIVALNVLTAFTAFIGAVEGGEAGVVVFFFVAAMVGINTAVLVHRARTRPAAPRREPDELDARHVLDLDARLEALEQAYGDAADAAKWRALVESGRVSGPTADAPEAGEAARPRRNGRA